jgi:hypothetical protein
VWPQRQVRQDRWPFGDKVETGCVALETGETGSSAFVDAVETGWRRVRQDR